MEHPSCTLATKGCAQPIKCETCGFDKSEIERRKKLPLEPDARGLMHKVIRRNEGEG